MLYPLFFVAVYLSHFTLLRLPYFWDEGGYYIPAALDFFRTGTLIPQTTLTNAHPPLPSVLLAGWWHLSGFVISGTRTLVCMVSAAALVGVFRIGRRFAGAAGGLVLALLTASYPVWYAQSTLAHADIFAAAFTLWAISCYLPGREMGPPGREGGHRVRDALSVAVLFSLAALSKETAIVTPVALAGYEAVMLLRHQGQRRERGRWIASLLFPVLPLLCWYGYHYHRTGFVFGNPEYLRYNATANLDAYRTALCLWHRLLHLTIHMNMFAPVLCAMAAALMPVTPDRSTQGFTRGVRERVLVMLVANWVAFSVLGGALLTRYLLPMYPLVLLLCLVEWRRHLRRWWGVAAFSFAVFVAGIFINPPYAFAPEDNLTYRDMIVLHQRAIGVIEQRFPEATVLTAWPADAELRRPELGYAHRAIRTTSIENFSAGQIAKAAAEPGEYDTALIFSTKWAPPFGATNLGRRNEAADARYFDFHRDLGAREMAGLLHGDVVWEAHRRGEWAAVLRFPRAVNAALTLR